MTLSIRNQRGMALIMSLVMVVIIAIIGIAIAQQVSSGRKSTSVHQDHSLSFIRSQSGIAEAEYQIYKAAYESSNLHPDSTDSFTVEQFEFADWWQTPANWQSAISVMQGTQVLDGSPKYIVEYGESRRYNLDPTAQVPLTRYLRITAVAEGDDTAKSYLQAYMEVYEAQ
ncbi:hypothetical protein [Agarivorans sp. Alg241-V36]|uniref:pilus assembly PilX family protein n=1 Tax=Agarivorans sp. Alg241-V36 TaxID=2305992 RepID=UPI0013D1DF8A|nr:hypothetical protein [Agarivorans sp. Alg241-V36]